MQDACFDTQTHIWPAVPSSSLPLIPVSSFSLQVIPPDEINVSFDDIGALEAVKNTLHEVSGRVLLRQWLGWRLAWSCMRPCVQLCLV